MMSLIPILPSHTLFVRSLGHTVEERFATIFRDTCSKRPPEVYPPLLRYWRDGQAMETTFSKGPSPYIACELDWKGRDSAVAMWKDRSGSLRFWAPVVHILPDDLLAVLIAHEIGHAYRSATDLQCYPLDKDEAETRIMVSEWGFTEAKLSFWLFDHYGLTQRLEEEVAAGTWPQRCRSLAAAPQVLSALRMSRCSEGVHDFV